MTSDCLVSRDGATRCASIKFNASVRACARTARRHIGCSCCDPAASRRCMPAVHVTMLLRIQDSRSQNTTGRLCNCGGHLVIGATSSCPSGSVPCVTQTLAYERCLVPRAQRLTSSQR
eukprot:5444591-Pyramimonas_sp.AAC.1